MLLEGNDLVISSEVARLEMASAIHAAHRAGRLSRAKPVMDRFDADCSEDGVIFLLVLNPETIFPAAAELISKHALRTLDAIHLAAALTESKLAHGNDFSLVTRDGGQADAARAMGLPVL